MNKKIISHRLFFITLLACLAIVFTASCKRQTIEDKATEDARQFTRKYCPTPFINYSRTDSIVFSRQSHVMTYYCTFTDILDNDTVINDNKEKISSMLRASVSESTSMKPYIEAGFRFRCICRSHKDAQKILLDVLY